MASRKSKSEKAPQQAPVVIPSLDTADGTNMTVSVLVNNHGNGPVDLDWGQTPALAKGTNLGNARTPTHQQYTTAGTWTITAKDQGNPDAPVGTSKVIIPWPKAVPRPVVTVTQDQTDTTGMTVQVTVDNHGNGPVTLGWGQTPSLQPQHNPGDGTTVTKQKYTTDGTWTITAADDDDPFAPIGYQKVTIPMPAPQPAPAVTVVEDPADATGMTVKITVDNHGHGPVDLNFGQTPPLAAATNPGDGTTATTQQYTAAGTWVLTAKDKGNQYAPAGTAQVTVPGALPPIVTAVEGSGDATGMTIKVTVDNHGNGEVNLDWGQTPALPAGTNAGDNTTATTQKYTVDGTWTITATDADDPNAPAGTTQVTVPGQLGPVITVAEDQTDATGKTVIIKVDNHGDGEVTIDWGQTPALPAGSNAGDNTATTTQAYTTNGTWTITAQDANDPDAPPGTAQITIPMPAPQPAPVITVGEDQTDGTGKTVAIKVDNGAHGAVNIDWGQTPALAAGTNPGDNTTETKQAYTADGTWTITATDADNPFAPPGTAQVTIPMPPPQPAPTVTAKQDQADATGMTVKLTVNNNGHGPVNIDWGQTPALAAGTNPGDNATETKQQYTTAGTWTIRVTDADNPFAPAGTAQVTLPYAEEPDPDITLVGPWPGDQSGMTAIVTVDNHDFGQVVVRTGEDGSSPQSNPGDGTTQTLLTYTTAGTYTATARDFVNAAATGTLDITVPLPNVPAQPDPTVTAVKDTTDASGKTVKVTVDNGTYGEVNLDWGQTPVLPAGTNPGDDVTPTTQAYTADGTWTITATDATNAAATGTTQVTIPLA